jgi:hypothetical protein
MKTKNDDNQIVDDSLNGEQINKWDHDKNSDFQSNLNGNELRKLVNDLEIVNLNNLTQEKINAFVYELGNVLLDSAKNTFELIPSSQKENRHIQESINLGLI